MSDEGYESGRQSPSGMASERDDAPTTQDTKRLADEAAKELQTVLERAVVASMAADNVCHHAGVSDDLLRNVVQKVQQRGRGGRTPAGDPRLDPTIEPKKAKRILANRLSAAKSKMRQRVLSESLEVLRAKENSRHASVEPSEGGMMGYDGGGPTGVSSDELRQVKRMCMELQSKNKELEARMRLLEAQMTIAASSSFHPHLGGPSLRVLSAPAGFSSDASAMLAALSASHGNGNSVGHQSGRPPLISSNLQQSTLNLLSLTSAAALAQSNLGRVLPMMDSSGRLDGAGSSCWLNMDCNGSGLGQLMVPSLGMLQHQGLQGLQGHQGMQILPQDAPMHISRHHHDE